MRHNHDLLIEHSGQEVRAKRLFRPANFNHLSLRHDHDPVRVGAGKIQVMENRKNGPTISCKLPADGHYQLLMADVQGSCGLVQQYHRRVLGQDARQLTPSGIMSGMLARVRRCAP